MGNYLASFWSTNPKSQDGNKDHEEELVWNSNQEITWTKAEETRLREDILRDKIDTNGEKIKMRILLFGQAGHGKSTLCNGFRAALLGEGHVSHYSQSGRAGVNCSYSKGVQTSLHGENLRIMDMSGIYESDKFTDVNIHKLLSGGVDFDEQMNEHLEVSNRNAATPKVGTNDISCLVIVLKPDKELGPHAKRLLDVADNLVRDGVISRHAVIPFLDKIDPIFKYPENIPELSTSRKVKDTVMWASDMTGIPASAISVVSNYWNQTRTDLNTNILLLHALEDILYDAKEHHEKKLAHRKKDSQIGT